MPLSNLLTGSTIDGVSTVDIPNEALTQKSTIKAYIYMSTSDEGETVNTVIMYLDRRIAPEGFEAPEDVDLFHYTLAAANEYLRQDSRSICNFRRKRNGQDRFRSQEIRTICQLERRQTFRKYRQECSQSMGRFPGNVILTIKYTITDRAI